ncbi:MAG: SUMF1/EgtB/PvdO family nonheme iron enzyme [Chlamydiales bacterium]|nr:SUMF1/EgtB/PvdO family nonheme iron enzyme [Chlamydiales bacterium]
MQEQILGDYRILKQVGQGTLGVVLLAEHRFIKKQYVLKVLPQELCQDRGFIERFEEEVAKLAHLDHPHIVKIHNVSFAEGLYFLVSDCVVDSIGETTNLAQYMSGRKERLREEELLSVMRQIADALDFAHTKGQVAHRALKLNNILIGKGNPGIEVYISDFGLAKIVSPGKVICHTFLAVAEALEALPVEKGGEERYSPVPIDGDKLSKLSQSFLQGYAFLAPEQKRFEQVGMQADSYAFGVLAYYLITGVFPEGAFEKPSKFAPDYRHNWDALIEGCLQADPICRPSQLRPLLEQGGRVQSPNPQRPIPAPRPLPDNKESAPTVEQIKATLIKQTPQPVRVEEPAAVAAEPKAPSLTKPLTPVINRVVEAPLAPKPPAVEEAVVVESKDVAEATPPPITPPKDEVYTLQLSSMLNRDPVVTEYQPEIKESKNIEPLQTEMVVIEGGEFARGSNQGNRDEAPCHMIVLNSFALDVHPVTNEQFVRFLEFMGGEKDPNYNDLIRLKDSRINRSGGRLSIESGYSKHPVVGVTWYGAVAYAKWVGKRLPSEAEWEIAARGGLENSLYPTGDNIEKSQANFFSSDTTKVMSYAPNPFGIYDMVGNVYEWCQDWYGYNYYETSEQEPHNPKGPWQGVYRVLRGGCWKSLKDDMRCAHRHRNNPGTVNSTYGFRCAADVR